MLHDSIVAIELQQSATDRGYLIPIGGAEDKIAERSVLKRFLALCGGENARLAIIPTASEIPDEVAQVYGTLFTSLGASAVHILNMRTRQDAHLSFHVEILDEVTGIFLTGGDQQRLVTVLSETAVGKKIHRRYLAGVTIAGTSAGAAAMSQAMIAAGQSGIVPSQSIVELSEGLGLMDGFIIDQHFRQRQRIGRLMTAVMLHPELIGIGVDEDTAPDYRS